MSLRDREVLAFLGEDGKSPEAISKRFPDVDITRIVRAGLVELRRIDLAETRARGDVPPLSIPRYMLTPAGADAIGLDPARIGPAA